MPVYTYICKRCAKASDLVCSIRQRRPKRRRCVCGGTSTRHFTVPQVSFFKPYVTSNITGEPIEISSAGQEDEVCNRHGLARLLDSEVIDHKADKAKRKKLAAAKAEPMEETVKRVTNELKYGDRPAVGATA